MPPRMTSWKMIKLVSCCQPHDGHFILYNGVANHLNSSWNRVLLCCTYDCRIAPVALIKRSRIDRSWVLFLASTSLKAKRCLRCRLIKMLGLMFATRANYTSHIVTLRACFSRIRNLISCIYYNTHQFSNTVPDYLRASFLLSTTGLDAERV
jgi:hypothetical protein